MQDFNQKIKQNALFIFYHKATVPFINLLITIYVIKKITVNEYGIYNLLYALIGYLSLFSSMGLVNVFQRFVPEYYVKKEYDLLKKVFNSGLLLRFLLTIIAIGIILIFSNSLNKLFQVENFNEYVEYFFIGIILFLEIQLVEVTLSSLLLNKFIMVSYLITTIFRAGLIYFFVENNMGIKGLLIAETISYGLLFLLLLISYYAIFASRHKSAKSKIPIKRLLRYGGFSYFDEFGETILDVKTDFFIIAGFLGPTMVGIYAFANQIIESVTKILPFKFMKSLIRSVFFTKFSENSSIDQLNLNFNLLVKIIAFISLPIFMGVIVFGDKIILYLFDVKYISALNLLWVFSGFMMINSFQFPLQLVVQALERVEITFASKIFSIYNLIGDLLIIQVLGILGVGLITCSARLFQNIFIFYRIRKFFPLKIDLQPLLKIGINSMLMIVILYFCRNFVENILTLILFSTLGLITYLCLSIINRSFFKEERQTINKLLPRPIFVF